VADEDPDRDFVDIPCDTLDYFSTPELYQVRFQLMVGNAGTSRPKARADILSHWIQVAKAPRNTLQEVDESRNTFPLEWYSGSLFFEEYYASDDTQTATVQFQYASVRQPFYWMATRTELWWVPRKGEVKIVECIEVDAQPSSEGWGKDVLCESRLEFDVPGRYIVVVKVRLVMKGDKRFSEKAIVRSHRIKVRDQAPSHRVNEKYDVLGQKRYR